MRRAKLFIHGLAAGILAEQNKGGECTFSYLADYQGEPISLTIPVGSLISTFPKFPPFLDGVLPEGAMLDALLRQNKIDRDDNFSQLLAVGADLVGAITVLEEP